MNIFFLDVSPIECAKMHFDKHVVKMIIEYAQLLSTTQRMLVSKKESETVSFDGKEFTVKYPLPSEEYSFYEYKGKLKIRGEIPFATHINHPVCVWVRQSYGNYNYLYELFIELIAEYEYRYKKKHSYRQYIIRLSEAPFSVDFILENHKVTPPFQAMPEYCKMLEPIDGYKEYYKLKTKTMKASYRNRKIPEFLDGCDVEVRNGKD